VYVRSYADSNTACTVHSFESLAVESAFLFGGSVLPVHAPSGAARRAEREEFYNKDAPYLFRTMPDSYIFGGDFNCVITRSDCTGEQNISKGLEKFVREFGGTCGTNQYSHIIQAMEHDGSTEYICQNPSFTTKRVPKYW
jgi:hypothetical protein